MKTMKAMKKIKLNDSGILFDAESHTYCTKDGEVLHGITGRLKERASPMNIKMFPKRCYNVPRQEAQGFTIYLNCMMK